ncbi:Crp/Fnr family transcriptional regulator, partial [Phascolarctobacterium succinatutens]|uniref:Crp/Fnr family transcriptional regulator n=1 Tax=Phascolarctobacterium succinatutens TaxID=626940 RepID=UPI0026EFD936
MAVKMFAPNYHDIPLFKGLGRDEINEVLHKFHGLIKHFPKSDYIYLAGDCIENLCVVMEGTVQMIKEDIWGEKSIIANLSAGDVFAENYLGKLSDRSVVSYFAASDSEILMLPLGRMLFDGSNHNETNRRLMCNIVSILADNNTRLIEKTEILCKKTLRGKIMAYLEQEARYNVTMENQTFIIEDELKKLPGKPGVYLMHGEKDEIIYVGKAISLKNRVRQYFQTSRNKGAKIEQMVTRIA